MGAAEAAQVSSLRDPREVICACYGLRNGSQGSAGMASSSPSCSPRRFAGGRETEHLSAIEVDVRKLVERHGISIADFGTEGALTLSDLAWEVAQGLSELKVDETGKLVRTLSLVEVSLVIGIPSGQLVLVQEEQVLDDGRRRCFPQRKLHGKMRRGESLLSAAQRTLCERLNLSGELITTVSTLASMVHGKSGVSSSQQVELEIEPELVQANSHSFPGLLSHYLVHRIQLQLPGLRSDGSLASLDESAKEADYDKYRALLAALGLPVARAFMSVEGELGKGRGGRVHLWRWKLAEDTLNEGDYATNHTLFSVGSSEHVDDGDHDDEHGESQEDAIPGIEEAYRELSGVLRTVQIQKAQLGEKGGHFEVCLNSAEERIKRVLSRLTNIEGLVHVHVNAQQLFGARGEDKRRMSRSLRQFISSNFTDYNYKQFDDVSSTMSPSAMSSGAREQGSAGSDAEEEEANASCAKNSRLRDGECSSEKNELTPSIMESFRAEVEELRASGGNQSWVLDAVGLHERTGRKALIAMAEAVVIPHSSSLGTSEKTMRRFIHEIHRRYEEHPNHFHNEAHATVVCHSTHWLAVRSKVWGAMSPWLRVATDIAALAHDVGHFGRNNAFCSNVGHELALIYNDRSILENMHAATCFTSMKAVGCNILADCPRETRKSFREHVVGLILATDMTNHFEFLGKFRVRVASPEFCPQDNPEDRRMVSHCFLKAADLGHAALPWELHERWAFCLLNEFYEQGDEERSLGMPVSPMCERNGNVSEFRESQKGFLQFVILPLFKELATVTFPEVGETCVTRLEVNAEYWVKSEPSHELVSIIQAAPGPPKSTVNEPFSPRRKQLKNIKKGRIDESA